MIKAYQFKVVLNGVKPEVSRTFIIPAEVTFLRFHDTLQFVMGWEDEHLFSFMGKLNKKNLEISCDDEVYEEFSYRLKHDKEQLKNGEKLHEFEMLWYERALQKTMKRVQTFKLPSYFKAVGDSIIYLYDFGDDWTHTITLEAIVEDYPHGYPMILSSTGACPPEDVGGVGGYVEFLEAWHNRAHPNHEDAREWGEGVYEEAFDEEKANRLMREFLKLKIIK